ncbi:hypothetical protein [Pararhodobacter sp. SW119]|nr:hypothetical protein [Pararhodobacter sp. SW119]
MKVLQETEQPGPMSVSRSVSLTMPARAMALARKANPMTGDQEMA